MKRLLHLILFVFVSISFSLSLAACQGAASVEPVVTGTPSSEDARRIIVHALLLMNTTPNRMSNTTVTADGTSHQNVIEFIPPDKKYITGEGTEIIVAGGKVYFKPSDSPSWQETAVPAVAYLGEPLTTEEAMAAYVEGGEYARADTLDGKAVGVFRYATTTQPSGVTLHSQVELWVGQADGLPYKMIVDGETLKMSMDPATGENKALAEKALSTSLIVFDPSIKIEIPIP